MIYVETDFLLALAKDSDWLQAEAETALEEHEVATSALSYVEFLLLAERYDVDRVRAVSNLLDLVPVVPDAHTDAILKGVQYQDEYGMTDFDALHAGMADTWDAPVLGSDRAYDELPVERIPLEPDSEE